MRQNILVGTMSIFLVSSVLVGWFLLREDEGSLMISKQDSFVEEGIPPEGEIDDSCVRTGCSSQLCEDVRLTEDTFTTCEWRDEYECYQEAECTRQPDGECGWTQTTQLLECLDAMKNPQMPPVPDTSYMEENSGDNTVSSDPVSYIPEREEDSLRIEEMPVSFGYENASDRDIDTVIIHSSFNSLGGDEYDVRKIVEIYRQYGVSAHYIIDRAGIVYRLVDESNISYHAGASSLPDGRTNVNSVSVGIEMVANYEDGFTDEQYGALNSLLEDIRSRYTIKYVLGHDEIAPERKTDPWNMDWNKVKR